MALHTKVYCCFHFLIGMSKSRVEIQLKKNPNNVIYKILLKAINRYLKLPPAHNSQLITIDKNIYLVNSEIEQGTLHVNSTPLEIEIGSTTVCNINPPCVHCLKHNVPQSEPLKKNAAHISEKYLHKITPLLRGANWISLHGFGEPLTCPHLFEPLAFAHKDAYTYFVTNGILLNDRIVKKIFDYKISNVNFSLDAATAPTYFKIRHHDFDKTMGNIRNLVDARNKAGRKIPSISFNMTLMRKNIAEFPDFIELAKSFDADVHIYHLAAGQDFKVNWFDYKSQHCSIEPDNHDYYIEKGYAVAKKLGVKIYYTGSRILFKNDPDFLFLSEKIASEKFLCTFPWKHIFIDTDGSVFNCCWQLKPLGHLKDSSLWEIWNGDMIKSVRKSTASGIPHPICDRGESSCPFVLKYLSTCRK